jgi:tetratricopeptide (TPR) repeat protein
MNAHERLIFCDCTNRKKDRKPAFRMLMAAMCIFLMAGPASTGSNSFDSLFESAGVKYKQGSYEEALKLYKKAGGMKKDSFECFWYMALTQNKLGQYKESLKTCDKLIKLKNANAAQQATAWNLRGRTLFDAAIDDPRGLNEKAIRDSLRAFREALRISPNQNLAHYNLGVALIRMDHVDEGIEELRAYLKKAEEPDIAEQARVIIQNPKIPVPVIELVKSLKMDNPDGFRYNHVVKVINWQSFPVELFRPSKNLPPCTMGASAAAMGTRLEITVVGDIPPVFPPNCIITSPERLMELSVFSQLIYRRAASTVEKPKTVCVRIKDRLTGNVVFSNPVALPKFH